MISWSNFINGDTLATIRAAINAFNTSVEGELNTNTTNIAINTAAIDNLQVAQAQEEDATVALQAADISQDSRVTALEANQLTVDESTFLDNALIRQEVGFEPTGYNLRDRDTHGVMELCPDASNGMYWRIDKDNVYTKHTGETTFGDGVTPLGDNLFCHYPSPGQSEFSFWIKGTKFSKTTAQTLQLTSISTKQIIVYGDGGVLRFATGTYDAIMDAAVTCVVVGNVTSGIKVIFANERHGLEMSGATHYMNHEAEGAKYGSGFDIVGLSNNAETFTSIAEGSIWDEDLLHHDPAINAAPFLYRDVNGDWNLENVAQIVTSTNALAFTNGTAADSLYNKEETNGTWSLVDTGSDYVVNHIFSTNDAEFPVIKIVGQTLHADRNTARDKNDSDIFGILDSSFPFLEFVHLYSYILDGAGRIETGIDGEIYLDYRAGYPVGRY